MTQFRNHVYGMGSICGHLSPKKHAGFHLYFEMRYCAMNWFLLVVSVAVLTSALAVLLASALSAFASDLESALESALEQALESALVAALIAAVAAASAFASISLSMAPSMAASMEMPLIFLFLLAKSPNSRAGLVLQSSADEFVRVLAIIQASPHGRFVAEVSTSWALLLERSYFLADLLAILEFRWRSIELERDMCLNCSVCMSPSVS